MKKFIIKCGNFAVLVDLHVLPLGSREDTSWFTAAHIEEVTDAVRDSVDQRVKQYAELLHNRRRQPKQRKELAPAPALFVKGNSFSLVANFLKRHNNLRCVARQLHGDLRVFPERYIVCVSCPEDASAHHGNLSLATVSLAAAPQAPNSPVHSGKRFSSNLQRSCDGRRTVPDLRNRSRNRQINPRLTEQSEQSRSEYFSRAGETQDLLNSAAKTKKIALQKIAKQASVQQEELGLRAALPNQTEEQRAGDPSPNPTASSSDQKVTSAASTAARAQTESAANPGLTPEERAEGSGPGSPRTSPGSSEHQGGRATGKRRSAGGDPNQQRAKRTCLGRPPASPESSATERSTQTSKPGFLTPLPRVEAETGSKAFPVSEWKKTTLEVELLTPGKQAQRLPLASNNTAQTNQNRLATSLRGQSVKPASSGSSISSRSTLGEEGSENVPRTSRLRRVKRS